MTKSLRSIFLNVFIASLILLTILTWSNAFKEIRTAKKNANAMKQFAAGFPHLFYPNYFFDINNLAEEHRIKFGSEELYYNDAQNFHSDVLQMATAPTKIYPLEIAKNSKIHVISPKEEFKSEITKPKNLMKCEEIVKGEFFLLSKCATL
ncbi:hypothetical protein EHQ59_00975 [Leptospira kemamanensis]|uniref:Uncharacterized protein n=1 Tax=Leptospira kemamanensis TaxID=2484942 RepID=A0A4R9JWV6_9LEPT|nr:hypothetical protein [Leptospira kemamanensis]TGL56831.1 hypothetical protein EHQ59_00975 [Leptospira kemamanensis]